MPEIYGVHNGLNLDNLDVTTDDEINTFLTSARIGGHESVYGQRIIRGPLDPGPRYDMTANSLWLYTRPDCRQAAHARGRRLALAGHQRRGSSPPRRRRTCTPTSIRAGRSASRTACAACRCAASRATS